MAKYDNVKEVAAESHFNIWVDCPWCNNSMDKTDQLKDCLISGHLSEKDIDEEVRCDNKNCNKLFWVTEITY